MFLIFCLQEVSKGVGKPWMMDIPEKGKDERPKLEPIHLDWDEDVSEITLVKAGKLELDWA